MASADLADLELVFVSLDLVGFHSLLASIRFSYMVSTDSADGSVLNYFSLVIYRACLGSNDRKTKGRRELLLKRRELIRVGRS